MEDLCKCLSAHKQHRRNNSKGLRLAKGGEHAQSVEYGTSEMKRNKQWAERNAAAGGVLYADVGWGL